LLLSFCGVFPLKKAALDFIPLFFYFLYFYKIFTVAGEPEMLRNIEGVGYLHTIKLLFFSQTFHVCGDTK